MSRAEAHDLWRRYVNPDFVDLLEAFGFGRRFVRAEGASLLDEKGRRYTDFLAGFGVHNLGHNHPQLLTALEDTLRSLAPSMLNVDAALPAGQLAERLTAATHPNLCRTAFGSSGAEVVDIALRAASVCMDSTHIIACHGAYHGLSVSSLSLMGDEQIRETFKVASDRVHHIPFGDTMAVEEACRRHQAAAFIVEPIQAEGGVRCPDDDFLPTAAAICRKHGVLLVVDEIQTGLGRTGRLFATDLACVQPDILLIGKALSGGVVPVSAAMMTDEVWKRAFSGPRRCTFASSTFAGSTLAMATGLTTLAVLERENLARRSAELGELLRCELKRLQGNHAMIQDIRGRGLLIGIEFAPPSGVLPRIVPAWAREGLYAQVVSLVLLRDHGILTQPCTLNQRVLRIEPPLIIERDDCLRLMSALDEVLDAYPSHASAVMAAFRRVAMKGDL